MRRTAILMLVLSLCLGALAVYIARDWVQEQVTQASKVETKNVNLTTVVVAKRPLHFGDQIGGSVVEEVAWPAENVPPGSFRNLDELMGSGERRVVLKSIQLNEPILKTKISGFGGRATLSTIIDKQLRAITIRVNDVNGVAGFVLPGDHVDILLTRKPRGAKEQITDVLMQNVKVLGIDQDAAEDKDQPKVVRAVTMEVSTEQSQKLTLAQMVGQLALALRSSTNNDPTLHRRIRERDLVDDSLVKDRAVSAEVVKPVAKPAKKVVRVRPRNTRTSVKVYRGVKPQVHEVTRERNTRRTTGPVGSPRKLTPKKPEENPKGATETGKDTAGAPKRLQPDASTVKKAPVQAPVPAPVTKPKPSDSLVDAGNGSPVALKSGN